MKKMKFKIGETVRVKKDLEVGVMYYSEDMSSGDTFSSSMRKNIGKEGKIVGYRNGGYALKFKKHIDEIYTYYDGMLEYPYDELAKEEYKFNPEVESLLLHIERERYKNLIDKALDERLFETSPNEFNELIERYNSIM